MTIVEKLKLSLEMLGGVATLNDIYKVFKKIDKDSIKTPQSSIRARIMKIAKHWMPTMEKICLDRFMVEEKVYSV